MKRSRSLTYGNESPIYFITSTVTEKLPIFSDEKICEIILKNLNFYRKKLNFAIYGYVIMPTHIHLLIQQLGKKNVSEFMRDFKKYTSVKIIKHYNGQVGSEDPTLTIKNPTPTTVPVGFSNPTARKTLEIFKRSAQKYTKKHGSNYQVWEERFDDVLVWSDEQFDIKLDYIHDNPCKESWNLTNEPQDYRYSSARNYFLDDDSVFRIDRIEV